ncbi:HD domain-containing protein [bacterium]|nr:HD domain-containing protein [bacterium]
MDGNSTIGSLKPGDKVLDFFVIRKAELKTKKDGNPYLVLNLGDASGRITATLWDDASRHYETFREGTIVKIQGSVRTYGEALQLTVERIRKAEAADGVSPADFVPRASCDVESLFALLVEKTGTVKNPHLRSLLEAVFLNEETGRRFREAPGGKLWHHAYSGGLIEHTLSVAAVCEAMCLQYTGIDRDLLITGALLHDIGKIEEYTFDRGFIDFTDAGRLHGHITIGARMIEQRIVELQQSGAFPEELKNLVIHLILSHQGELEHGSPVLPATLEAIVLYYADEMDSKANAIQRIIERDSASGKKWSQYINLLDRFIYLGSGSDDDQEPPSTLFD